jgi:hypothetical protein
MTTITMLTEAKSAKPKELPTNNDMYYRLVCAAQWQSVHGDKSTCQLLHEAARYISDLEIELFELKGLDKYSA